MKEILLYWGSRPQNITDCAKEAICYITFFATLSHVKEYTLSKKIPLDLSIPDECYKSILNLEKKQIKKNKGIDVDDDYFNTAGNVFSIMSDGKWSLFDPECIVIKFSLGSSVSTFPNSVMLQGQKLQDLDLVKVFKESINFFKPDYGIITSREILDQQTNSNYFTGWVNFFSNDFLPKIPTDYRVENMDGMGKLIVATDDQFDTKSSIHLRRVMDLHYKLKR